MDIYFNDITEHLFNESYLDKITYFKVTHDFNLPIGYPSTYQSLMSDESIAANTSKNFDTLGFKVDDIVGCGSMKYQDTDREIRQINLCLFNGIFHPFSLSKEFFKKNEFLFNDITDQIIREYKINMII